jgi:hypothetical protein
MWPPGCHLLLAGGAFSTRAVKFGQLHAAKKHRIQFGHCRLTMLFPIAQLIEIALAGMPFTSGIVVVCNGRADEVTATPLSEPMNPLIQLKLKRSGCHIPRHTSYDVVSDCSAMAKSRRQTLGRGQHHRPRVDTQARHFCPFIGSGNQALIPATRSRSPVAHVGFPTTSARSAMPCGAQSERLLSAELRLSSTGLER